jgi:hypothetical protein
MPNLTIKDLQAQLEGVLYRCSCLLKAVQLMYCSPAAAKATEAANAAMADL